MNTLALIQRTSSVFADAFDQHLSQLRAHLTGARVLVIGSTVVRIHKV